MLQALTTQQDTSAVIELVRNGLTSEHSKRAYTKALQNFLDWRARAGNPTLTKALVNQYKQTLTGAPSSVNLALSAIRKLAQEAADNGLMDNGLAEGVRHVQSIRAKGVRAGNWLTKQQAQELLTTPDITTLKGLRDRAILAVMIGAGLRRAEIARLQLGNIQQRDGRWLIVDIIGKGQRVRSVPIPAWAKLAIDEWLTSAGISEGVLFRAMHRGGIITGATITPQGIRDIVKHYGLILGMPELAAHDLRRTYAKLAYKGGAGLDQIQLSLGHASMKTTEHYLGVSQCLTDAPCDHLGLSL